MKKHISSIGKVLSKTEQKSINGGLLSGGLGNPCPIVLLAAPPEGCRWVGIPVCRYKLVCDAITIY
ncbi:hypothetical protein [Kordia jejudonensis]|uniref:hypothetical protein n=1 Tax=Kordia jejudonensis TaxID=1348245 RepID=UPI000629ACC6|nr:hypothetical protein [Kordia jejudonensis]